MSSQVYFLYRFALSKKDDSYSLNGEHPLNPSVWYVSVCVDALTAAVSFVWGSEVATRFSIHRDSHSLGCELYSTQDKTMPFTL